MMEKIAFIISRIFDPAILTAILIAVIFILSPLTVAEKMIWLIIFELINFVVPVALFIYLRRTKKLSDIDITNRTERLPLFRATTILYGISFLLSIFFNLPKEIIITAFSAFLIIAVWTMITPYWKISVHVACATTCVMLVYFLTDLHWIRWMGPLLIIIVTWSRYIQQKHTVKQLAGALILSLILVIGIIRLY